MARLKLPFVPARTTFQGSLSISENINDENLNILSFKFNSEENKNFIDELKKSIKNLMSHEQNNPLNNESGFSSPKSYISGTSTPKASSSTIKIEVWD